MVASRSNLEAFQKQYVLHMIHFTIAMPFISRSILPSYKTTNEFIKHRCRLWVSLLLKGKDELQPKLIFEGDQAFSWSNFQKVVPFPRQS
jgi:hypothetical protein